MRNFSFVLVTVLISIRFSSVNAQDKYWVYLSKSLKDSSHLCLSAKAIQNRSRLNLKITFSDYGLDEGFKNRLSKFNVNYAVYSRWLHAISIDHKHLTALNKQFSSQIDSIKPIEGYMLPTSTRSKKEADFVSTGLKQIQYWAFLDDSLDGDGVDIGIIDAGFYQADADESLKHLFDDKKVKATNDFVKPSPIIDMANRETFLDNHGTMVWRNIAGYSNSGSYQSGLATASNYYLARTDHGIKEFRGEEDYWVAAMEWMDSLGVRLINTSLGYALNFDNPAENYSPSQMDGKTSVIARAAQMAVNEKGMIIVSSAGNEGELPNWRVVSTPADAKDIISVGANKDGYWIKESFSSIGPNWVNYVKPDISAFSNNGTSFSAPIITGVVACLLQLNPSFTNNDIKELLAKSSHLYPYPNNYLGYGVPIGRRLLDIAQGTIDSVRVGKFIKTKNSQVEIPLSPNAVGVKGVVVFQKSDSVNVIEQIIVPFKKKRKNFFKRLFSKKKDSLVAIIKKEKDVSYSTVSYPFNLIEIKWE